MEKFLRGQYDAVLNDPPNESADFPQLFLKCRAAGALFEKYFLAGDLYNRNETPEEAAQIKQLCRQADAAHETAFRKSRSEYEKAVVLSHWWSVSMQARYAAPSPALLEAAGEYLRRSAAATQAVSHSQPTRNDEFIGAMSSDFRALLEESPKFKEAPASAKDAFAKAVAAEFASLSPDDLPPHRKALLLQSLPLFVKSYLDMGITQTNAQFRNTMRWHIWMALTTPLPDSDEQERILAQVEQHAKKIESTYDDILTHPLLENLGNQQAQRFRQTCKQCGTNLLIPGFKQAIPEHQWTRSMKFLDADLKQFRKAWQNEVDSVEKMTAGRPQETLKRLSELQKLYSFQLYGILVYPTLAKAVPGGGPHMLGQRIIFSGGSLNEEYLYPFSISRADDILKPEPATAASGPTD